jgi:hypothetical protein
MHGDDAWLPEMVFMYGLDTVEGRPNEIVPLVSVTNWTTGPLSTETNEGKPFVDLPVI